MKYDHLGTQWLISPRIILVSSGSFYSSDRSFHEADGRSAGSTGYLNSLKIRQWCCVKGQGKRQSSQFTQIRLRRSTRDMHRTAWYVCSVSSLIIITRDPCSKPINSDPKLPAHPLDTKSSTTTALVLSLSKNLLSSSTTFSPPPLLAHLVSPSLVRRPVSKPQLRDDVEVDLWPDRGCTYVVPRSSSGIPALVQGRQRVARQGDDEGDVVVLVVVDEVVG